MIIETKYKVFIEFEAFQSDVKGEVPNITFAIMFVNKFQVNIDNAIRLRIRDVEFRIRRISVRVKAIEKTSGVKENIRTDRVKELLNVGYVVINIEMNVVIVSSDGGENNILLFGIRFKTVIWH